MRSPKETLGGRRAVVAADMEVMHGRERSELAVTQTITSVMMQRQLAVASFHTGTAALEHIGAGAGNLFDLCARLGPVKEIRRMMRTEIRFGMPAQGLGFVGGALHHLHGDARAGIFQHRRPGRRRAISSVPLQQNEVRRQLDGHQAAPPGWNVSSSHTVACRGAMPSPTCRALRPGLRDQGRFQGHIELVLRAVAHPDEIPSGVRTNATRPAGASPGGCSWHHSSKVLRATPEAAAASRCVSPAANRDSVTAMCSACSKCVRRVTTRSLVRVAQGI